MKLRRFIHILTVAVYSVVSLNTSAASAATFDWELQTGITQSNYWNSVAYGNGVFVAVGDPYPRGDFNIATSTDGVTWTAQTSPNLSMVFWGVIYNDGLFVAVGRPYVGSTIVAATSPNGIEWTASTAPIEPWRSLAYGNGKFVAISQQTGTTDSDKQVMTSADGKAWTQHSDIANSQDWQNVAYGNGKFVAIAYDFTVMTSADGEAWNLKSKPSFGFSLHSGSPLSLTYGAGKFVLLSSVVDKDTLKHRLILQTSTDGEIWQTTENLEQRDQFGPVYPGAINFDGDNFVVLAHDLQLTSQDGTNWTATTVPNKRWIGIVHFNGLDVAVSDSGGIMKSGAFRQPESPAETPSENESNGAAPPAAPTAPPAAPTTSVATKVQKQNTLPKTGGDSSMFALFGGLFVAGGLVLAMRRRILQ